MKKIILIILLLQPAMVIFAQQKLVSKEALDAALLTKELADKAHQVVDPSFNPPVQYPIYEQAKGTEIWVDAAHKNFHTINGRYKAFASILRNDGYVPKSSEEKFTSENLKQKKILVISNASGKDGETEPASVFTDAEISALNDWVKDGGSLFLIADHMPLPAAAAKLGASFGFKFYNGFAFKKGNRALFDTFTLKNGGLKESPITNGRSASEKVTSVQTFTGQAFEIPENAKPIVALDENFEVLLPTEDWGFNATNKAVSGKNLAQIAYLNYGKGKLVVSGEAGMFSAQFQGDKVPFGLNDPKASQNIQFLLNTIHWLDGVIK